MATSFILLPSIPKRTLFMTGASGLYRLENDYVGFFFFWRMVIIKFQAKFHFLLMPHSSIKCFHALSLLLLLTFYLE